jgi:hypothetical protein
MNIYTFIIHYCDGSKMEAPGKGEDPHKALVECFHRLGYWSDRGASPVGRLINRVKVKS